MIEIINYIFSIFKIFIPNQPKPFAEIIREYHKDATVGKFLIRGKEFCRTLELKDDENKQDISCIPEGIYSLKKDFTGRFQFFKVLNVPNRSDIEIHPANKTGDLLGCIALGEEIITDYIVGEKKYSFWLTNSTATCIKLKKELPDEFVLEIKSV